MNTLDMRQKYTENDEEEVLNEPAEEVKKTAEETEEVKEAEEKETPSESSTESEAEEEVAEKTNDEVSSEGTTSEKSVNETEVAEEVKKEDVEGLARQKEKLLADIRELRQEKREEKDSRIYKKEPLIVPKEEDLADVAEADINLIEKVLKAKGYVRKDEVQTLTYKEKVDSYKNQWLENHPEYLPENDKENIRWDDLNSTIIRLFKMPDNPKDIVKVLDTAHSLVSKTSLPTKSSASERATKEKIKTISKSSAGESGAKVPQKSTGVSRNAFAGFTEEELKEMGV